MTRNDANFGIGTLGTVESGKSGRYGGVPDGRRGAVAGFGVWMGWVMVRGFFRLIGLVLLVLGFLALVYDGARSIADQTLRLTRVGELWNDINQGSQHSVQSMVVGFSPLLWNAVIKVLLNQPAWAVMGILGILLMLLFRPGKPLIGYSRN